MIKATTIIGIALAVVLSPAWADDESVWLTTGEWSRHTNQDSHQYRQNNTGVGIQYELDNDSSFLVGWYNNSVHRETVYMGMAYAPLHIGDVKIGAMGAIATGYTYVPAPIASIYGSYEYERFGLNLFWLPSVVVAIQLKVRLSK